eukprot:gene34801-biopygen62730
MQPSSRPKLLPSVPPPFSPSASPTSEPTLLPAPTPSVNPAITSLSPSEARLVSPTPVSSQDPLPATLLPTVAPTVTTPSELQSPATHAAAMMPPTGLPTITHLNDTLSRVPTGAPVRTGLVKVGEAQDKLLSTLSSGHAGQPSRRQPATAT